MMKLTEEQIRNNMAAVEAHMRGEPVERNSYRNDYDNDDAWFPKDRGTPFFLNTFWYRPAKTVQQKLAEMLEGKWIDVREYPPEQHRDVFDALAEVVPEPRAFREWVDDAERRGVPYGVLFADGCWDYADIPCVKTDRDYTRITPNEILQTAGCDPIEPREAKPTIQPFADPDEIPVHPNEMWAKYEKGDIMASGPVTAWRGDAKDSLWVLVGGCTLTPEQAYEYACQYDADGNLTDLPVGAPVEKGGE
jgi:hypothetical protein